MTQGDDNTDLQAGARAPAVVRRAGLAIAAVVLAGALYLIAARGDAIVLDLSAIAGRFWCF